MTTTPTTAVGAFLTPAAAAAFCDGLAAYNVVTVTYSYAGDPRSVRLMARDMPRPGRRYTHLDASVEVFALAEYLGFVNAEQVTVTAEKSDDPAVTIVLNTQGG